MNRDQVRATLAAAGVSSDGVSEIELKKLRKILSKYLIKSGIYHGTARIARAKKDLKFIEMKTENWTGREAVSFNPDGFIDIAGWADNKNVKPILDALLKWSDEYKC